MFAARFDDLRPRRRRSFEMTGPDRVVEATSLDEVGPALAAVQAEVEAGRWVAGWVTYEAAPAFDPALHVRPVKSTAVDGLPYVWFGVFADRGPATPLPRSGYTLGEWTPRESAARHHAGVETIRGHIRSGDTYQANYTFRIGADFDGDPRALYRDLSHSQNSAYGAFIDAGRWVVVSASPELFIEWKHGRITSKPMKGTTRRGLDLADDEERRSWLEHSEKNRAENLMIVDMVRNDLGRIARTGTVRVPALFTTEKYDTVWQLTSTVVAEPRTGTTLVDAFGALFPCASITGAPKVATMDIIADLESDPRGVYCGAVGFGGPGTDGTPQWAFNVGIRTILVDRERGQAHYGTGGGITYDSTPSDEYDEALLKARVLDRRSADFELLETMRWEPTSGFRHLHRHLHRLSDSAWYFDVPLDPAEVRAALDRATVGHEAALRVRLTVDRTGWVHVTADPAPGPPIEPVTLAVDTVPVDAGDPFLHHKTTDRRLYETAAARHPDADDVVLVNDRGEVTETTIASLAVHLAGRWVTPPLTAGCLPGVERAAAIEAGLLSEAPITIDDLERADGIARLNSLRGWEDAVVVRN
ncbi:MAG: aminodeoxychorismate synthase component I [Acidimicrobiia bacterium]|nr:aminodeoxychorismate synthase component I [Acidimicrobiia bacterium]MDH5292831.1 aminodeoxychorismate synthase component I [Acidimicrobiia bacterium]